jgi:hypothetical protein
MAGMSTADPLEHCASQLVEAARAFHESAERPGRHVVAPAVLESLEEALQVLSGAWYQLAADASPGSSSGATKAAPMPIPGRGSTDSRASKRCASWERCTTWPLRSLAVRARVEKGDRR